jgi:hypothetical protein
MIMGDDRRSVSGLVFARSIKPEEQVLERRMPWGLLALEMRNLLDATMREVQDAEHLPRRRLGFRRVDGARVQATKRMC